MRSVWSLASLAAVIVVSTTAMMTAPAAAQSCRFAKADGGGTVCACKRGGSWRLMPRDACRGLATTPAPAPKPPQLSAAEQRKRLEVREIQTVLNAVDCDAGTPDGLAGRQTRSAIECFQRAVREDPTGELTDEQREVLLDSYVRLPESAGSLLDRMEAALSPAPVSEPVVVKPVVIAPTPSQPAPQPPKQPATALGFEPDELLELCRAGLDEPPAQSAFEKIFETTCMKQAKASGDMAMAAAFQERLDAPPAPVSEPTTDGGTDVASDGGDPVVTPPAPVVTPPEPVVTPPVLSDGGGGDQPLGLENAAQIQALQRALQWAGYDIETINGVRDEKTEAALTALHADYQRAFGGVPEASAEARVANAVGEANELYVNCRLAEDARLDAADAVDIEAAREFCWRFGTARASFKREFIDENNSAALIAKFRQCGLSPSIPDQDVIPVLTAAFRDQRAVQYDWTFQKSIFSYAVFAMLAKQGGADVCADIAAASDTADLPNYEKIATATKAIELAFDMKAAREQ